MSMALCRGAGSGVLAIGLALTASALVVSTGARGGESFRQIKGREITARFTGMEFTDEVHWAYVFAKGGQLVSFSMGKKGAGAWRVEKDELCLDRERTAHRCYQVWMSGKNVQLREPGTDIRDEGVLQRPAARQ